MDNCANGTPQPCVPGTPATETCNGVDDDCDATPDDNLAPISCGVGACLRTVAACVSGVPQVCTPGTPQTEVCNAVDDDCDGTPDDGLPASVYYRDQDGDLFGDPAMSIQDCRTTPPTGYVSAPGDCNDTVATVNPGAAELCDGLDNDCSTGSVDGSDEDGFGSLCATDGADVDLCPEGVLSCAQGSLVCADLSGDSPEICANTQDDDCDGASDENGCVSGASVSDTNGSGRVDGFDLAELARAFNARIGSPLFAPSLDLDKNGIIDGDDVDLLGRNFGQSTTGSR